MGLGEMLAHWGNADKLQDKDVVLGLYAIWWARMGVAMQLAGGIAVVADLLGEEKIKARAAILAEFAARIIKIGDRHWKPVVMLFAVVFLCSAVVLWFPPWFPAPITFAVKHGAGLLALVIIPGLVISALLYNATNFVGLVADIITNSRFGPMIKILAYGLPVIGTALVMLTS